MSFGCEHVKSTDRLTTFVSPVLFCGLCLCFVASRDVRLRMNIIFNQLRNK